jgi:hypothetical protein
LDDNANVFMKNVTEFSDGAAWLGFLGEKGILL